MTPCTPSGNHVANWQHRLSALEGLATQVVAIVSKINSPPAPLELAQNAEKPLNAQRMSTRILPCHLGKTFESNALVVVNVV